MEVALLKQRLAYNYLPDTLNSLEISLPPSLDTIQNETIRQCLYDRHEKIIQRTKSDMLMNYISTAEAQLNEYQMKFDIQIARLKENQRCHSQDKKLSETMLTIMYRSIKNTNERLKCLYQLKVHFFVKAPTVTIEN